MEERGLCAVNVMREIWNHLSARAVMKIDSYRPHRQRSHFCTRFVSPAAYTHAHIALSETGERKRGETLTKYSR